MNFDEEIDRIGTHSVKWDMMGPLYNVAPDRGLPMWVADMDFRPPVAVQNAMERLSAHGIYGYYGDEAGYLGAIQWWMETQHDWQVDPAHIFTTHGLVNGTAMVIDTFTSAGDGVVLLTPVYHAFARIIRASGRDLVECPLARRDGRYEMDFDAWDAQMRGHERMLILCSPHNPGGRVWSAQELRGIADFCLRHDLLLVSDEIHHDLVFAGNKHHIMAKAAPDIADRLVMMTSASKTFNIAGGHVGNVIISDSKLRARFAARMVALGMSPNAFGLHLTEAAYSPSGAEWLGHLLPYVADNLAVLHAGLAAIPGVHFMPLEATYLAWIDFSGTGMSADEIRRRVHRDAGICTNYGESFGLGGADFLRFNVATPRARVQEAVARLQTAFADLQ